MSTSLNPAAGQSSAGTTAPSVLVPSPYTGRVYDFGQFFAMLHRDFVDDPEGFGDQLHFVGDFLEDPDADTAEQRLQLLRYVRRAARSLTAIQVQQPLPGRGEQP